jgi:hypothetical protein
MMPEDKKDPVDELKDKVIDKAAEAAEDLVEELVEDLTDGKDNSDNPWYRRWWNSWTKGVSVLAIIGGLGTWGLQFSIEWYKERKEQEYQRIEAVEKQLEEVNRRLAVQNEAMKAMNEARKDNNNERMAMWRALRANDEEYDEMKVQVRINAILNERNYRDIKEAHSQSYARHDDGEEGSDGGEEGASSKPKIDINKLTPLQKAIKKTLGTPEEKEAIKEQEEKVAQDKKIDELLEQAKKKPDERTVDDFKNEYIQQQQQQIQQKR